jgi:[NiFe] hydrogenase diaphorase moiety large subunit
MQFPAEIARASVDRNSRRPDRLLPILHEIQQALGHLPGAALAAAASELSLPLARVRGVAGFYRFFSEGPSCRYRVLFSDNITDRMSGSEGLMSRLCHELWVEPGRVSEDGLVMVDRTSCTGMCDQGPALLVNGRAVPRISGDRLARVAALIRAGTPVPEWPPEFFQVEEGIRRRDRLLESDFEPGAWLERAFARGAEGMLREIESSGLRGRGGAGFPTGRKWRACREAPGAARHVVCNADEGEPGTFKDRVLLEHRTDMVLEGMTICALVTGAHRGFLYLRGEYEYLIETLESALARRRARGLLGRNIAGRPGFDFEIEVCLGAGAYICGEESALLESLEGKRGIPRNRPPYPVTHGFLQQPTVINNVETLCAAAWIAESGADAHRAVGTAQSSGTKLFSVSGDCERPGVYEYPLGVAVRRLLEDCGARDPQAVQVGGPSGRCISAPEFERRLCFEDLSGAGAFMVFDRSRDMFEVARNFSHFFAHESCGFCTPCRVGTTLLDNAMEKFHQGRGTRRDLDELERLNTVLRQTAHCGLGQTACNPVLDTLRRFPEAYERRVKPLDFEPAFDLDAALTVARQMTGRDDPGAHLRPEDP